MGTDIHLYVERREGDRWVTCDTWEPGEYDPHVMTVPYGKHFYHNRCYDLFAILADVRNGRGFAGTDTGDGFVPIALPRGLPDDMSPELRQEVETYLEHTPSWLLLAELMAYDWTQVTTKRGYVNGTQFDDWNGYRREDGYGPHEWCGGVGGGGTQIIAEDEMVKRVREHNELFKDMPWNERKQGLVDKLGCTYTQVSWTISYYRAANEFLSETLPRLWRLGKPEDVRIVFWFDS